jgi:hypothetical protein
MISEAQPNGWGLIPLDRALIGGAQPLHGWWAPDALRYIKGVGAAGSRNEVRRAPKPHSTNPRPSDRLAQWRREAPPRRHLSTAVPPSSDNAGGGPKEDAIYFTETSTPWTPPDPLPPMTV